MGSILSSKFTTHTSMTPSLENDGSIYSVSDVTSNEDDVDGTATDNTDDLSEGFSVVKKSIYPSS